MKIKILIGILSLCLTVSMVGCGDKTINVNVENSSDLSGTMIGTDALIEIGSGLWYDSTTRIVYWWSGVIHTKSSTAPTPYYAPNGLPYRYNPESNTFEEIGDE